MKPFLGWKKLRNQAFFEIKKIVKVSDMSFSYHEIKHERAAQS